MPLTETDFFDEDFFAQFPELSGQIQQVGQSLFPVDALSAAEAERMGHLQRRAAQLSPLEAPALQGSTAIPGNPYSVDISPVTNAVQQGLVNVMNAARQRRLLGTDDEPGVLGELGDLQSKAETAASQQESQQDFLQNLFPELATRLFQAEKELQVEGARQQGRLDLEEVRGQQRQDLEEVRQQGRETIEHIRNQGRGGGAGDGIPTSVITNFANQGRNAANVLFRQAEQIQDRLNDTTERQVIRINAEREGRDPNEVLSELEEESTRKSTLAWRLMRIGGRAGEEGGLPPELIQEYEDTLNEITGTGALDDL